MLCRKGENRLDLTHVEGKKREGGGGKKSKIGLRRSRKGKGLLREGGEGEREKLSRVFRKRRREGTTIKKKKGRGARGRAPFLLQREKKKKRH